MFHVTTVNLATDTTAAHVMHGAVDVGELTAEELVALLERFRRLDPVQNHEADPHLFVMTSAGKFRIRTGQGKLFLDNARDTSEPYAELTTEEIIRHVERSISISTVVDETGAATGKTEASPNHAIAAAILVAGLALNGYTLYSVFYTQSVNEKPAITLLTDPAELSAHQHDAVGTYATGDQSGDRTIAVSAGGKIVFAEVGAHTGYNDNTDTYRLGRLGKNFCLTTVDSGVVEIVNIDTLIYYRDTYKRR
jgi:hypothetical protein